MTSKRNDPCPCGSGKKYKHCCRKADLARERAEKAEQQAALRNPPAPAAHNVSAPVNDAPAVANAPAVVKEPEEVDPELERLNQLYEEFDEATYAERKAILRSAIEEKALDGELAFEFFNELFFLSRVFKDFVLPFLAKISFSSLMS